VLEVSMKLINAWVLAMSMLTGGGTMAAYAGEGSPPNEVELRPVSERYVGSGHDDAGNPYYVVEITWSDGSKTQEARPGFFT
jgi:hypothetical protein